MTKPCPCPCCDAAGADLNPVESFVLGAGLSEAGGGLGGVRETLCTAHRIAFTTSMVSLRMKVDRYHEAGQSSGDPKP